MHTSFTDNGTSAVARVHGGEIHVHASGTWSSGTLKFQFQGDDGLWYDFVDASWTADVDSLVDLGTQTSYSVRTVLSGAGTPALEVTLRD